MQRILANWLGGDARLASVCSFPEVPSTGAEFRVALEFVRYMWTCTANDDALVELERTMAILAAKLSIAIDKSFVNQLDLPERLVPTAGSTHAAAFYFTFVELFRDSNGLCEFRERSEHGLFRGAGL
jgi:hypothetical protein